jgi:hypothetical protein
MGNGHNAAVGKNLYVSPATVSWLSRTAWNVFRDEDEIPASSDLSNQIKDTIPAGENLSVICSTDTSGYRSRLCTFTINRLAYCQVILVGSFRYFYTAYIVRLFHSHFLEPMRKTHPDLHCRLQ